MPVAYAFPIEAIPSRYRCCHCLHVRTGTLLLAIFQIIVHFVIIAILTAALGRASRFRDDVEYAALSISVMSFIQWERFTADSNRVVPNPKQQAGASILTEGYKSTNTPIASKHSPYTRAAKYFMNAGEEYVAIAVTLISLLFSIMMLIGTIYTKPYYLLPYCCLQFLDLFVTCLSVVGFYTYLPETDGWIRPKIAVSLLVVLAGVLLLVTKAYLLAMVWLCYKFLLRCASGLEPSSGFSLAASSCLLSAGCFERLSRFRLARTSFSSVHSTGDDIGSGSDSATGVRNPSGRRVVVLFHRPGSRPAPTINSPLSPPDICSPPKYEDVLAMPSNAYDPPPYEFVAEAQTLDVSLETCRMPTSNEASNSSPDLTETGMQSRTTPHPDSSKNSQ